MFNKNILLKNVSYQQVPSRPFQAKKRFVNLLWKKNRYSCISKNWCKGNKNFV